MKAADIPHVERGAYGHKRPPHRSARAVYDATPGDGVEAFHGPRGGLHRPLGVVWRPSGTGWLASVCPACGVVLLYASIEYSPHAWKQRRRRLVSIQEWHRRQGLPHIRRVGHEGPCEARA